ncbi:hypothetical protein HPP92_000022 [Vanilla planifolia]|uniref:Uncharacterized protein n=1 Tax=Vanilla planifolia TaxID=51239 RepID=A0A835S416_VANPL|nr:hypothetical protein HPP92_000022 [Vanilla planifolia]
MQNWRKGRIGEKELKELEESEESESGYRRVERRGGRGTEIGEGIEEKNRMRIEKELEDESEEKLEQKRIREIRGGREGIREI